eukprot:1187449-Prorocentrum_minimum.AAC.2
MKRKIAEVPREVLTAVWCFLIQYPPLQCECPNKWKPRCEFPEEYPKHGFELNMAILQRLFPCYSPSTSDRRGSDEMPGSTEDLAVRDTPIFLALVR